MNELGEEWLRCNDADYEPTPSDEDPGAAGWSADVDGHGRPMVGPHLPSKEAQARERKQRQRNRQRFAGLDKQHDLWVEPGRTRCQDGIHRPDCRHVESARVEDELRRQAADAFRRRYGREPSNRAVTWMVERNRSLLGDDPRDEFALRMAASDTAERDRVAEIRRAAGYAPEPEESDDDWGLDTWKDSL